MVKIGRGLEKGSFSGFRLPIRRLEKPPKKTVP